MNADLSLVLGLSAILPITYLFGHVICWFLDRRRAVATKRTSAGTSTRTVDDRRGHCT